MALHPRINPDPIESIAQTAQIALMTARKMQTRRSGTSYWGMGDGTGIILGDDARDGVNRYVPDTGVQLPLLDTSGIESQISKADSQITNITQQITNIGTKLNDTNKAIDAQTAKMQAQAQAITAQAAKDKQAMDASITKLQEQADQTAKQAADDKSALQTSIGKLQAQAQATAAQAAKDKQAMDDSVSALAKRMGAAESTAQDLSKHLTDVQSTVNGQASRLTTFDQRITANASTGAATAKLASQIKQTVTSLSATLSQTTSTANDALKQVAQVQATAQGIKTTLSQHYATKNDVDSISVGGTNLLLGTATPAMCRGDASKDCVFTSAYKFVKPLGRIGAGQYTLSFDYEYTGALPTDKRAGFYPQPNVEPWIFYHHIPIITTGEVQHYTATIHVDNTSKQPVFGFRLDYLPGTLTISNCKIERGNKPTDWSPAPQDLQPAGDYATSTQVEQTAQGLSARINNNTTTIAGTKTDINQIKVTAQGLQASLSDVTKTATSNTSTIAKYKAAQDQLSATLTKTTQTAQGAVTAAAKAQATADAVTLNLSKSYTTSADADAKYATQAALKATADGITSQFEAQAKTNKGYETQIASIQATAQGITQQLSDVTKTANSTQTTVTTLKQTVAGNTSQIKQTTDTAQGLLTKTQQLSNSIDGLKLNLTSNYATKTDLAHVSVGGTNLLVDTKAFGQSNAQPGTTGYLQVFGRTGDPYNGFTSRSTISTDPRMYTVGRWTVNDVDADTDWTVSFYAKGTGTVGVYFFTDYHNNVDTAHSHSSTGEPVRDNDGQTQLTLTTQWRRYSVTWHIGDANQYNHTKHLLIRNDSGAQFSVCAVKLERGTRATDWSPAPQDLQPAGDYATVKNFAQYQATVQSLSAQIGQVAKTAQGTQSDVNSIKVTAKGLQASLSDVTKTADSTSKSLTQYKAAQDQLSAQLSKTTSTAQGAVTAAAKAQATADGISLNLSKNYTSAKDADAKYATQAALKTTSDGITAQFSKTSSSIAGIQHDVNSIKVDATGIHGTLTQITNGQGVTNKTVKSIQDTISGMQSTLTSTTKTANSALTNTTTLKTGLNSVNLTMSQHYQQMLANTQMGENLIPNGNADPNAKPFNGWKINNHAYEIVFPGKQTHVDFVYYDTTHPILAGHTYRFSVQARVISGTCSGSDRIVWGFGPSWSAHAINLAGVGADWVTQSFDLSVSVNQVTIYMSSFVSSAGAKTVQLRALSVIDVTAAAQAQTAAGTALTKYASLSADLNGFKSSVGQTYLPKGDAAKTYTTNSQVQQTAKQISAQVVSNYKGADGSGLATQTSLAATKKDILAQVSQNYTTKDGVTQQVSSAVKQTADSLTTTFTDQLNTVKTQASNTQTQVNSIQAMIREDSAGIHVGRLVDGKQSGYSALVGSDGSFQVLDGAGASYATLKPLNLTLGTMDGDKGNCVMSVGPNGMSVTYKQMKGHGGFGHDTYGMATGINGININSPDGSWITAGTGGISIHGSDGSHINMGPSGISIANGDGNKIDISPYGFLIQWNRGKYSFSGDKNGILHAPSDKRLR